MNVGDTFLMEHPRGVKHLFVVVARNDSQEPCRILTVYVMSCKPGRDIDESCILKKGDHEFIRHRSYVAYFDPLWTVESFIQKRIQSGVCRAKASLASRVLKRVIAGGAASAALPLGYKKYFGS